MRFFCDKARHLICVPYSAVNLHAMAKHLGLNKYWYHYGPGGRNAHYDIPVKRIKEISLMCEVVTTRELLDIIRYSNLPATGRIKQWKPSDKISGF